MSKWCEKCKVEREGKFCLDCGSILIERNNACSCSASIISGAKFCPECGLGIQSNTDDPEICSNAKNLLVCPNCKFHQEDEDWKFCSSCGGPREEIAPVNVDDEKTNQHSIVLKEFPKYSYLGNINHEDLLSRALKNDPWAQVELAERYENGDRCDVDLNESKKWSDKAINLSQNILNKDDIEAKVCLAICFLLKVNKNEIKALELLKEAYLAEHKHAGCRLGLAYYSGIGDIRNINDGIDILQASAYDIKNGNDLDIDARYHLGIALSDNIFIKDEFYHVTYLHHLIQAASLGHFKALMFLEKYDFYKNLSNQSMFHFLIMELHDVIYKTYLKYNINNPQVECMIGDMFGDGEGVEQNLETALSWYEKSRSNGFLYSQFFAGIKLLKAKDIANAKKHLERALSDKIIDALPLYSFADIIDDALFFNFDGASGSLYLRNVNMDGKKLDNAKNAYGKYFSKDKYIVLYDHTFFGSAKEGYLITEDMKIVTNKSITPKSLIDIDAKSTIKSFDIGIDDKHINAISEMVDAYKKYFM